MTTADKLTTFSPAPPPPEEFKQIVLPGPGQNVGAAVDFQTLDFTSFVAGINDRGQISGEYWGIENLQGPPGVHVHGFITAPRQDFEVTLSAVVSASPITGTFEGGPIGEGNFTLGPVFVPRDIPFGLFVNCGRVPPPLTLVLTTNTGDQISVDLLVTLCQTAFEPVPFTGVITGLYRITGGMGRFAGASGSGFVTGTFVFPAQPPGTVTFTLEGSITRSGGQ
jgi:hypothetical protein